MPGIMEVLSKIDTAKLSVHLDAAHGTVHVDASASLGALNPRDLLGDFGKLLDGGGLAKADPQALVKSLSGMIGELGGLAQAPAPALFANVAGELDRLIQLLQKVAAQFTGDGSILDKVFQGTGGFEKLLGDLVGRIADALPLKLPDPVLALFSALEGLGKGGISDPHQAADLLARFLMGMDLNALGAPLKTLEEFLAKIRVAGGDFGPVHLEMEKLTVQIRNVNALLLTQEIDVPAAQAALTQAKAALELLLNNSLAGAIAKLNQDLAAIDPGAFAKKFGDLLGGIPANVSGPKFDIEQDLVRPMRALGQIVDELNPAVVKSLFDGMKKRFSDAAATAGIPDLLSSVDDIFDIIIEELRRVPLRSLRDELVNFLIGLESKIRGIPGLDTPHLFGEEIGKVEHAIDNIDTASIQKKVAEFAAKIDAVAKKFPITDIKNEVQGLIGDVQGALDQIKPALDAIGKQFDDLGKQIEAIDFNTSGQASIGLLHDIRESVQKAVGSSDIPEPAKMAIGVAAGALKSLDVKVAISKPFDEAMAKIDPSIVLAPIDPMLKKVRQVLETVSPKSIIDQLDKPFQELLSELEKLKPAALLAGLSGDFAHFTDLIGKLDPRTLVAPLEDEFQKAKQAIRTAIDPAPLFAPLHLAYQKLQQLLDLIDLEKLFGKLFDSLNGLPGKVAGTLRSTAAQKVSGAAAVATGDIQALRFGDIIRPLIALIGQVKSVISKAAGHLVSEALQLLNAPVMALASLAEGAHQLLGSVAHELDQRAAELDLFAATGPAVELRASLLELQLIAGSLSGNAQVSLGPLALSLDIDVHAQALNAPMNGLQAQSHKIREGVAVTGLVVQLNQLGDSLGHMAPAPLRSQLPAEAAQRVAALFDFVDFEPLAKELDNLGEKLQSKLLTLIEDIVAGVLDLWDSLLNLALPLMPLGIIKRIQAGMKRVRAEFAVLDPTPIEAEVGHLLDVALSLLDNFSPTKLVADLGGIVDSVKAKLGTLDPVKLLGQLDPVSIVIDGLQGLKPSVVLAPLLKDAEGITAALENLTKVPIGDALIQAAAKLKAELQVVVEGVEKELQDLLSFLEGMSGGGAGVSISASIG